jgi:hypothetical protein
MKTSVRTLRTPITFEDQYENFVFMATTAEISGKLLQATTRQPCDVLQRTAAVKAATATLLSRLAVRFDSLI